MRIIDGHAPDFFDGQFQRDGNLSETLLDSVLIGHILFVGDVVVSEYDSVRVG